MVYQFSQFYDIAINGFQIVLSIFILCYYLKNRGIYKKLEYGITDKNINPNFEAALVNISVQQRIYQAFTNILDTISIERTGLEKILENHVERRFDGQVRKSRLHSKPLEIYGKQNSPEEKGGWQIRQNKIRKFSSKGLNPQKISETLKIPLNEVELILSLDES